MQDATRLINGSQKISVVNLHAFSCYATHVQAEAEYEGYTG
jgi:hypothetical protein